MKENIKKSQGTKKKKKERRSDPKGNLKIKKIFIDLIAFYFLLHRHWVDVN